MGSSAGFLRGYCCGSRGRWFNDTTQNEGQIPDVETRLLELADKIQKDEAGSKSYEVLRTNSSIPCLSSPVSRKPIGAGLFGAVDHRSVRPGVTSLWRSTEMAAEVLRPFGSNSLYHFFAAYRFCLIKTGTPDLKPSTQFSDTILTTTLSIFTKN